MNPKTSKSIKTVKKSNCEPKTASPREKNESKLKQKRKDPEENLGNVVSLLDTAKIERGVDFGELSGYISAIMAESGKGMKEFFDDCEMMASICKNFELTFRELVALLVEHDSETYDIAFMRSVVRPFVARIRNEKYNYDNETELNQGYKPIFDFF